MSARTYRERALQLKPLIEGYLTHHKVLGRSPATIHWHRETLNDFLAFLNAEGIPERADAVDLNVGSAYVLTLQERKQKPGVFDQERAQRPLSVETIRNRVRSLRAFFHWLEEEEVLPKHPLQRLKPPKSLDRIIERLTEEEIRLLFAALDTKVWWGVRDQAILAMLLETGMRAGELVGLQHEDVRLADGFCKVLGKGNKERLLGLTPFVVRCLQRYEIYRPESTHPTYFLSDRGRPLSVNSLQWMMRRLGEKSGVTRLHPHLCRHTYALNFLVAGGGELYLQRILGHSSLKMTQHYASLANVHVVERQQQFSPLSAMGVSVRGHRGGPAAHPRKPRPGGAPATV